MAEKIVSPGVFTKEVDQSFLPAGIAAIGAAVIGPTVKGPANIPTVVSSYSEYSQIFGDTFTSGSGTTERSYAYLTSYTAKEYLKHADTLTVVRVLAGTYSPATAVVSSSTTTGVEYGRGTLDIMSGSFGNNAEFQITAGGTAYRFIASHAASTPSDSSPIYFFATGSGQAFDASISNLATEINNASIGVSAAVATDYHTAAGDAIAISASAAGTSGNNITVVTGSGDMSSNETALTLTGGTATTTEANCFTLTSINDGEILNSNGPTGTYGLYASGSKDNFKFEVVSRNTTKGTFKPFN